MKNEQQIRIYSNVHTSYNIKSITFEGSKHLVVPVVMMVEGVHSGSGGPILHLSNHLGKFTPSWNDIPVVINHPQKDGINISAKSPEVLATSVGRVFNAYMEDGKLKGEIYINEEKIKAINPIALAHIQNGNAMDVSVGVFSDNDKVPGEWNGKQYNAVAQNYRPDHLALLPGGEGACSWNDGCGIRVNKKGEKNEMNLSETFRSLNDQGFFVSLICNEQGYNEQMDLLRTKLNTLDTDDTGHYLIEVFDDRIVYEKYSYSGGGGSTLYQQSYSADNENNIVFEGMATEVRRKVEYVTMSMIRTKKPINTNKGGKEMSDDKKPCCEKKVLELIANKASRFTEDDKLWLLTQEADVLEKLFPIDPKASDAPQVNKEEVISAYKQSLKTLEDYTALMPENMKNQISTGITLYNEGRATMITAIMDNNKEVWEKSELEAMSDVTLKKVFGSSTPVDYSGNSAGKGIGTGVSTEKPLIMAQPKKNDK